MNPKKQRPAAKVKIKDIAIGFFSAVVLMLVLGAAGSENQPGRYQCCPAGDSELAVFIIDTRTAQTWRLGRADTHYYGTPQQRQSIRRGQRPIVE